MVVLHHVQFQLVSAKHGRMTLQKDETGLLLNEKLKGKDLMVINLSSLQ